jgi:hypothetical protein
MPDDIVVDGEKFNRLLKKLIEAEPLPYRELIKEPKLRKDGKRKRTGRTVRKPDKSS